MYKRNYFSDTEPRVGDIAHHSYAKSWQAMFNSDDPTEAELQAAQEGFQVEWPEKRGGVMTLLNCMPATRNHTQTGEEIWSNHLGVLHHESWYKEYAATARRFQSLGNYVESWQSLFNYLYLTVIGRSTRMGTDVLYGDGSDILDSDVRHFRAVVERNMVMEQWQTNDLLFIDNQRIAHARMPYTGPRKILVVWTEP
mmetsp:Transcript_22351/g.34733  ORF Transcript_22351/g.34733 Transcript_22351/m.34733 type:complete len:197 (-) Transcript_22351:28-618(-)